MLVLRKPQMEALAAPQREIFLQSAAASLGRVFPGDARLEDAKGVRVFLEDAIVRARAYGIEGEREVLLFAYLLFDQGAGFESRPEQAWIERALRDGKLTPGQRMDVIYARLSADQKRRGS